MVGDFEAQLLELERIYFRWFGPRQPFEGFVRRRHMLGLGFPFQEDLWEVENIMNLVHTEIQAIIRINRQNLPVLRNEIIGFFVNNMHDLRSLFYLEYPSTTFDHYPRSFINTGNKAILAFFDYFFERIEEINLGGMRKIYFMADRDNVFNLEGEWQRRVNRTKRLLLAVKMNILQSPAIRSMAPSYERVNTARTAYIRRNR